MPESDQQRCCIVLVRTKYPGNLGSVARAMANFGISELRLVEPQADPASQEARALASHGENLLKKATCYQSLTDAVADTIWVAGTSARTGGLFRKQNVVSIREGMPYAHRSMQQGKIAFVFGPEDHGLTNDEVSLCHYLFHIPCHPGYNVLNLSQAVVITLYEWYQQQSGHVDKQTPHALATTGDLDSMFLHLESALRAVHFIWGDKGDSVAHALRHLISRSQPTELENKLLHGLARQLHWYVKHYPMDQKEKSPAEQET